MNLVWSGRRRECWAGGGGGGVEEVAGGIFQSGEESDERAELFGVSFADLQHQGKDWNSKIWHASVHIMRLQPQIVCGGNLIWIQTHDPGYCSAVLSLTKYLGLQHYV